MTSEHTEIIRMNALSLLCQPRSQGYSLSPRNGVDVHDTNALLVLYLSHKYIFAISYVLPRLQYCFVRIDSH